MDVSKLLVRASAKSAPQKSAGADSSDSGSAAIECAENDDDGDDFGGATAPEISYFETDAFKKVAAVISLALRAFNVVMASLLSVFVPQTCDPIANSPDVALRERHDCTMTENFTDLIALNTWALAFNFACLGAYLALFLIQVLLRCLAYCH
jgi:hypothetical protein